jgi:hypothetical protein
VTSWINGRGPNPGYAFLNLHVEPDMTVFEYLAALGAKLTQLAADVANLPTTGGAMTPEQEAALNAVVTEMAAVKSQIESLAAQVAMIPSLQTQVSDTAAAVAATAAAGTAAVAAVQTGVDALATDVAAVKADVAALKGSVGAPVDLPPLS